MTFLSARPSPASAMLRDILFAGSRLALKSVCLRVDAFAAYTSPNPLPPETITAGFAVRRAGAAAAGRDERQRDTEHEDRQDARDERAPA